MKTSEIDSLIEACLDGRLTESEAAKLSHLIETSPDARARYWETASIHGMLEQSLHEASLRAVTGASTSVSTSGFRPREWRPFTAAAAGIVAGVLTASVAWAYAIPFAKRAIQEKWTVLSEGFEDASTSPGKHFPKRANEWSGDIVVPLPPEQKVAPRKGLGMVQLKTKETRRLGYAWRILDLEEVLLPTGELPSQIEVSAFFGSPDSALPVQYQIRLAAFREAPTEVRDIWNDEPLLFNTVLQHTGRNVILEAGDHGWQKVRATLDIPPGTRSLVISLGAGCAESVQTEAIHYLDEVTARLVFLQSADK